MIHNIKIRALAGNWSIRAAGAIIGETHAALELVEHVYALRIYFPRKDIAMAFLNYTQKMLSACTNVTHDIFQLSRKTNLFKT